MHTPINENPFSSSKLDDVKELQNPTFNDSLQALFNEIKFSPPAIEELEIPAVSSPAEDRELLNHLDDTLYCWLREIQRLEGTYKSDAVIKNNISSYSIVCYKMV